MVRQRIKEVSKEAKATWISYYLPAGTKKVLEVVGVKVKEIAGIDMMEGMDVEKRPYPGVFRGHYKFGCYRCTKVHGRGRCPETIISINSSDNSSINTTAVGDSFHSFKGNNSINSISNMISICVGLCLFL